MGARTKGTAKRAAPRKRSSKKLTEDAPTTVTPEVAIHTRAMLVSLRIGLWAARKFDRKVSREVNEGHGASEDAGRYNKHLLGGTKESAAHAATVNAASVARNAFYEQTLPWSDEGWRLLPTANTLAFAEAVRAMRERFERAVDEFIAAYPALRENARIALNGLYRDEDYPGEGDLRRRFKFDVEYAPIPQSGDFRLDLPSDQIREIEKSVNDRVSRSTDLAMRDAWNRLFDLASKFHTRMSDPEHTPKRSLIEGGREIVEIMGRLNVTGDTALEQMRARIERELLAHEATELREVDGLMAETAKRAADIMAAMQDVYGGGLGGDA